MTASLKTDIIDRPALWKLYLEVTHDALEVMAYSAYHEQSLIHRRLPFDPAASSQVQALGDLIYDNELLLADFARVSILIDTPRFMVVPSVTSEDVDTAMATSLWGGNITLLTDKLPTPGVKLMTAPDRDTVAFLRRTYPTVTPSHPMSRLITYFFNRDRLSNTSRMYIHLRGGHIDIIYFDCQNLRIANTFAVTNADDMIYYTLLVARNTGFDLENDDVMVCGTGEVRDHYHAMLRKYARYVMPVMFPSEMYHAGKEALESPFQLIIMPLCE